jgi:hypothetical protein
MRDFFGARRVMEVATLGLCFSACHGITDSLLSEMDIVVVVVIDKMSSVTPVGIRIVRITEGIRIVRIICPTSL